MAQSVILYSEIIPTILAVVGIYFLASGILDHQRSRISAGIFLFIMAVIVPFVILTSLI